MTETTTAKAPTAGRRPDNAAALDEMMQQMFAIDVVRAFPLQPTDVVVATYAKCGTTWMQQIVHGIRTRGSMDFDEISTVVPFMEAAHVQDIDLFAPQVAEPRAFKTHVDWSYAPRGGRYICVLREPSDALVSLYYFLNGTLLERNSMTLTAFAEELFIPGRMPFKSYWANVRSWWEQRENEDIFFICYEDMKADLPAAVRRVARFMRVELDDATLDRVTEQAGYEFMRAHLDQFDDHELLTRLEKTLDVPRDRRLEKVRAGQIGSGKRELSAEVRSTLDALWKSEIAEPLGFQSYDDLRAKIAECYP